VNIHYLQHVPFEGLGSIANWVGQAGHNLTGSRLYAGEALPDPAALDWLIVMGGPMGVHDERHHPWLTREKQLIEQAIGQEKTVLGICLGAQLIADVLGARVYANEHREIGWFPVRRTSEAADCALGRVLPEQVEVFHWHGDTFDLPAGAVRLARSEACENQAFIHQSRVLGLQFHLETTPAGAEELIRHGRHELVPAPYVQPAEAILGRPELFATINTLMTQVLQALARAT